MKLFKKSLTISMNNRLLLPFLLLMITPFFLAYRAPVAKDNESNERQSLRVLAGEKYVIDKKESVMTWKCSMALAIKGGHNGFVSLSKGELMIEKGKLAGGRAEIDMNTITDERHDGDNGLVNHLKDTDFFDVKKFPTSTFVITKVTSIESGNASVSGDLTIKGITHEVTFPAKTEVKGSVAYATGKLVIDRTQWDVKYKSGTFFVSLADEAIADSIAFEMKIVARK